MSNQKTYDPFSTWKELYSNTENYWGQAMEDKMKTEEFSEWLGKVVDSNLLYKQMTDKATKQYLDQMNLPSREDLANLSSLIVNLDTKVDDLEEQIEESLENQTSPAVVKREMTTLKKEVKDISNKLDEVLEFLKESAQSKNKSGNPTTDKK
ncbi:polyhydroxyalkanoic acid synthase subunit PhaR [Bacillus sp. FJAT-45350]|uniref:polyhydroxyalkanoic acid synthase subunit PhaR n=1 Tax=Bacillus sp. FJAT-45350 TaxID=2011014 RepID=UPI000BB92C20|nr:polyhydroxyalkanoic acid synthase subunit PhaR [Bacillus sp. FJAT-45350]